MTFGGIGEVDGVDPVEVGVDKSAEKHGVVVFCDDVFAGDEIGEHGDGFAGMVCHVLSVYLTIQFITGNGIGDRETGLFGDTGLQLGREFTAAEKPVHTGQINIEFIYRGLFKHRHFIADQFGHKIGILAVRLVIALHDNRVRAKPFGHIHGHGGMDTEFAGLITTGSDYAAVTATAHQHRFADQFGIDQAFHGNKKGIEVKVGDMAGGVRHGCKILIFLVFLICFPGILIGLL